MKFPAKLYHCLGGRRWPTSLNFLLFPSWPVVLATSACIREIVQLIGCHGDGEWWGSKEGVVEKLYKVRTFIWRRTGVHAPPGYFEESLGPGGGFLKLSGWNILSSEYHLSYMYQRYLYFLVWFSAILNAYQNQGRVCGMILIGKRMPSLLNTRAIVSMFCLWFRRALFEVDLVVECWKMRKDPSSHYIPFPPGEH
jgi:hypothetical protein